MKSIIAIAILITITAGPTWADVVIVKVPASVGDYCLNDGYVYGRDTNGNWWNACNYGNALNTTFGTIEVGNRHYSSPEPDWYYRWKGFLRFDLTELEGEINSIRLFIWVWRQQGAPWSPLYVYKTNPDWYPLSNDDFEMSAPWLLGTKSWGSFTVGDYNGIDLNPTPLSLGEWLPLRLQDHDYDCWIPPSGDDRNSFDFYSRDLYGQADTTKAPFLVIDYTPTPPAAGNYRAKVQTGGDAARLGNFGLIRTKRDDE